MHSGQLDHASEDNRTYTARLSVRAASPLKNGHSKGPSCDSRRLGDQMSLEIGTI